MNPALPLCGRPTKRGEACRLPLRNGHCLTHDCDLSARNSHVAHAFASKHPRRFKRQRRAAGHNGFIATGGMIGWARANEMARQWRLAHPSEPEQWAMNVLAAAGLNHYEREYRYDDSGRALDLAWPDRRLAVEVWGHQDKPAFGAARSRFEKQQRKLADLFSAGWTVYVVNSRNDRAREAAQLVAFLREHPALQGREQSARSDHNACDGDD
jgi:hypothetical protein